MGERVGDARRKRREPAPIWASPSRFSDPVPRRPSSRVAGLLASSRGRISRMLSG